MEYFDFEFSHMKKMLLPLGLTTGGLQLLFLYFFAIVGRFDTEDGSSMLTHYNAVLALATIGTMCVLAIYGTVLAGRYLVHDYVGMNKSKTYLLPISRKALFYTKTKAFTASLSLAMAVGLLVSNLTFMTTDVIVPLTKDQSFTHILNIIVSTIVCICLTLTVVLFSSFIGIKLDSAVKGITASIIFVVFLSNLAAIALMSYELVSLLIAVALIVIATMVCISMGNEIDKSEAL
ncbi:hypothetical protein IWT25_02450 [Secundilactobacillus pentosiphilus]|uniref:ABC transporter permease protein n=1 Tax=Secundilactobacillus pentosiphilus TaxID=1714682 RepID=A0A1Z5IZV1_9LACO|nr:hypothetical protein [Secundilactobacillus pentosiphilus]GAX07102.1 hypothetical protein IWT25_02450 [Secundilactobacillus pentosiphilus]